MAEMVPNFKTGSEELKLIELYGHEFLSGSDSEDKARGCFKKSLL